MIFDCKFWAVVKVETGHRPDGSIDSTMIFALFQGVWDSQQAAETWAKAQPAKKGPSAIAIEYQWDYDTEEFIVIPCAGVKAQCLSDLENMLEKSAKLIAAGVGV